MKRKSTINIFSSIKCLFVCLILRIRYIIVHTFHLLILDTLEKSSINHVVAKYHAFVYFVVAHVYVHKRSSSHFNGSSAFLPYQKMKMLLRTVKSQKNCSNISGCTEYMCIVPTKNRCIFLFPNNNPTTTKNFKAFCIYLQKKKQVLIKS